MTRLAIAALAIFLWASFEAPAAEQTASPPAPSLPILSDGISQRLEERAASYLKMAGANGPANAARYSLYDLAMPSSYEEYSALGKNTVIEITSVSQKAEELPIKTVHIVSNGRDTILQRLGRPRLSQVPTGNKARDFFGPFREDSFYLAPLSLLLAEGRLTVDFATGRDGFVLTQLPLRPPRQKELDDKGEASPPSPSRLTSFIQREFPDVPFAPTAP